MNEGRVEVDATMRGGPLLSLAEAVQFTGLSPEVLIANVWRRCYAIRIAKKVYLFENDLRSIVKFYQKLKGDRHG